MKRTILFVLVISLSVASWAQKKNVNTAAAALNRGELEDAKSAIDAATTDESTKDDPKTWFYRGEIYTALAGNDKYKNSNPQFEAAKAYMKVLQLNPSYNKEDMDNRLDFAMRVYFNEGIQANAAKNYTRAVEYFTVPITIKNIDNGKRFSAKTFDTIAANAEVNRGYSAYFNKDYEKALADLTEVKNNPITRDVNIYLALADIYEQQKKDAELATLLDEGMKQYPDSKELRNAQLNIYIKSGRQDELLKKLEEAVAKDPTNAELQFNLGNSYNNLAFPKDAAGKDLAKPSNYNDLLAKAEKAYQAALTNDKQHNVEYQYNMGALFFNQASDINKQMNALGTSSSDQKKYDELKIQRDAMFAKAMPYLESTFNTLDTKSSFSPEDKNTYQSVIIALKEIYARQSKMDKVADMKKKLEEAKLK